MTKIKRRGLLDSEVRMRIVRAAAEIIGQEGFAAVTAPRLAEHIGLQRPIIYYYFEDMDQIRIEAVRLAYEETKARALARLSTDKPIDVLWRVFENAAAPLSELTNYSIRGEPFRPLLADIIEDIRSTFSTAIDAYNAARGLCTGLDAAGVAFLIQAVSTAMATERSLGLKAGHSHVRQFLEAALSGQPRARN